MYRVLMNSSSDIIFHINFICWISAYIFAMRNFCLFSFVSGLSLWCVWEYIYHRFMMHGMRYVNEKIYYYMHGHHHVYPHKKSIHIPPFQWCIVLPCFFLLFKIIGLSYDQNVSYSVGLLIGSFIFDKMHQYIHLNKNNIKEIFEQYHLCHHKSSKEAYCVTSPLMDIMLRTFPYHTFGHNLLAYIPIPYYSFKYGVNKNNKKR